MMSAFCFIHVWLLQVALLSAVRSRFAIDGNASTHSQVIHAKAFAIDQANPAFPSPHSAVQIGISFSGGGVRAHAFTMGVLRALSQLGHMSKVDAVSSVSGGTWASSIYMFAHGDDVNLLGTHAEPSELTLNALEKTNGNFIGATNTSTVARLANLQLFKNEFQVWRTIISERLEPFGLGHLDKYMAGSEGHLAEILEANPGLAQEDFYIPRADRPKAFIMNGVNAHPEITIFALAKITPLQMCPDITGTPFWPNDAGKATPIKYHKRFSSPLKAIVGGGMLDTFAFGSAAPTGSQSGGDVETTLPKRPFALADAVAISSAAFYRSLVPYWPVLPKGEKQKALRVEFGDGGHLENTGLLALLQRRVKKAVVVSSTAESLSRDFDFCIAPTKKNLKDLKKVLARRSNPVMNSAISSMFGFPYQDGDYLYVHNHVFEQEELLSIVCELQRLVQDGKPAVVSRTLVVRTNTYWGIQGGFSVDLILVYLEESKDFEDQLPSETHAELGRGGRFEKFPQFGLFDSSDPLYLPPASSNLLAALGEYYVNENADIFGAMLG